MQPYHHQHHYPSRVLPAAVTPNYPYSTPHHHYSNDVYNLFAICNYGNVDPDMVGGAYGTPDWNLSNFGASGACSHPAQGNSPLQQSPASCSVTPTGRSYFAAPGQQADLASDLISIATGCSGRKQNSYVNKKHRSDPVSSFPEVEFDGDKKSEKDFLDDVTEFNNNNNNSNSDPNNFINKSECVLQLKNLIC